MREATAAISLCARVALSRDSTGGRRCALCQPTAAAYKKQV
ncbi:hypothetical protein PF003_g36312 [Phytophthora fragariae]|nr:hypothetical protein PF003_g36312 [Phytophthora fragariae]